MVAIVQRWSIMPDTYTLEIIPTRLGASTFQWLIRRNMRMYERSDRSYESAEKAERAGKISIEKLTNRKAGAD